MDIVKLLKDKKTWFILAFIVVLVLSFGLLFLLFIKPDTLARITVEYLVLPVEWIDERTFSIGGPIIYLIVMAIQGLLIPIPSEIILLISGLLWGPYLGTLIGTLGSLVAGSLCYYITLKGGRPIAEKLVGNKVLNPIDNLIKKYGTWFIFIARALPMMAFDPISYAGGLLKFNFKKYF
ncbi:MAG: TVP38/TMEM64 family protein, partial [Promethearchaeota archaeon]